ncbi:MAG TPA: lamin tail domain-containing protein, partial [Glaciihabitans sp.]|nr:lamin tail domain-containing protein [Glaciihabitans sp.]
MYQAARLTNNTGATITSLDISYIGEQWRNGGNVNTNALTFQYQVANAGVVTGANAPTTGWTTFSPLTFTSPVTGAAAATLDGNAPANRTAKSATLTVSVNSGQEIWLRWQDPDDAGSDHGLAIDDFSVTAHGAGATNPSGVGAANPGSVSPGAASLLTVAVTPGTSPPSTAHTVTADLTAIGGLAGQTFFDNATNGDITAGDNVFSFNSTVAIGTSGGVKNLPATITETSPLSRTGSASISLTVVTPTPPTGVGAANPNSVDAGNSSLLTVTVTPGANPTSTGLGVSADLGSIGGSSSQPFFDDGSNGDVTPGNNVFSYSATVTVGTTPGVKSLPFAITDAQARSGSGSISLSVSQPPVAQGTIVISQIYGGGGNSGATYTNDFVEIFNRGNTTVSLAGWSVQYTSSSGTGSWSRTPLSGALAPGQYYLVQESAGAGGTTPLPTPNAIGTIAMSGTNGHIALVTNNTSLPAGCPNALPQLMDLVGYGTAACFEGAGAAPGLDNVTADFRSHLGCKDTDSNGGNFFTGSPNPRNTSTAATVCPVGDFEPEIFATSPTNAETHVPVNGNITINFDEPVNVTGNWFQISCTSGPRNATVSGGPSSFILNP